MCKNLLSYVKRELEDGIVGIARMVAIVISGLIGIGIAIILCKYRVEERIILTIVRALASGELAFIASMVILLGGIALIEDAIIGFVIWKNKRKQMK